VITKIIRVITPNRRFWFQSALCACLAAAPLIHAGEPARFIDLANPDSSVILGEKIQVKVFHQAGEPGIFLNNKSRETLVVKDVAGTDTFSLAPGMRMGISCSSAPRGGNEVTRTADEVHLSLAVSRDVVYRTVPCSSLVRFSDAAGGAH
jgi:hypothetical protein